MLFVPPRHGKSSMVTVRYPVWRLEREPEKRIIVAAYNQTLANKFSRQARRIAVERINVSEERTAVEEWETVEGGGFRAIGVGGGITGQGGHLIVIDDPVKNREEASSEVYREKVWEWYTDDLYTRLEPGGAIILIQTRWHEDDLAGRILQSEDVGNWTVVSLPAEAEEGDLLGREIGQALCEERYPKEVLERIHRVLGSRSYHALYQQSPQPDEGGMFKRHWFEIVKKAPAEARRIRYWDFAATEGAGAFTAGVKMAYHEGIYYIEDVIRGQWSTEQREKIMKQAAILDDKSNSSQVSIWFEQEPGSSGVDAMKATIRLMTGHDIHADKVTGAKELRWSIMEGPAEAGDIKLVLGSWNNVWLDEMCTVPNSKYRDQADATAGAFNKLYQPPAEMSQHVNPFYS